MMKLHCHIIGKVVGVSLLLFQLIGLTAGDGVKPLGGGPAKASTPSAPDATIGSITVADGW
jgi:hypothetical protein